MVIPTIHVADLDAATAAAVASAARFWSRAFPCPGVGWLVYLADIEGNLIGIMQDDPRAVWPHAPTKGHVAASRGG